MFTNFFLLLILTCCGNFLSAVANEGNQVNILANEVAVVNINVQGSNAQNPDMDIFGQSFSGLLCEQCYCWNYCESVSCQITCYIFGFFHIYDPTCVFQHECTCGEIECIPPLHVSFADDAPKTGEYDEGLAKKLEHIKKMNVSKEEQRSLAFMVEDVDKDGFISKAEIMGAYFDWNVLLCINGFGIEKADTNGNDCVTRDEFIQAGLKEQANNTKGGKEKGSVVYDRTRLFDALDKNKDGCLKRAEIQALCVEEFDQITPVYFARGFHLMDLDGDGKLSVLEFMAIDWPKIDEAVGRGKADKDE